MKNAHMDENKMFIYMQINFVIALGTIGKKPIVVELAIVKIRKKIPIP